MTIRIKICGITNMEDALLAVESGADMLGFVFWDKSPRSVTPEAAALIIEKLPPEVTTVGVFVDEDPVKVADIKKSAGLSLVQLHGSESPAYCRAMQGRFIKALRVKDAASLRGLSEYGAEAILLDTFVKGRPGGTGAAFDWSLLTGMDYAGGVILAGGLTPDNVEDALSHYSPLAVDVSSGVEAEPGKKDPAKVGAFIEKVRSLGNVHK
ncbi:Phosphoribosylanthranilate isomerase [hydrothermal vent metagenome]|uniref:phosphoribosylanthranilate isomerase n=1 Tax=hydrothermal vent metagenome TaxID=652676 RepID=A0A3B0VZY4_9ZZZZ